MNDIVDSSDIRSLRSMSIWVDADACPTPIKEILFRAARRTGAKLTLIANHAMFVPSIPGVSLRIVPQGFDVADHEIVKQMEAGDLVVTADIALAADVLSAGGQALNPRGDMFSTETIQSLLTMRDFMDTLRSSGVETRGPPPMGQAQKNAFAKNLDRLLAKAGYKNEN